MSVQRSCTTGLIYIDGWPTLARSSNLIQSGLLVDCSRRAVQDRVVTLTARSGLISVTEREPHHISQGSRSVRAEQSLQHSYRIGDRYLAVPAFVQGIEECTLIGYYRGRNRPFNRARLPLIT